MDQSAAGERKEKRSHTWQVLKYERSAVSFPRGGATRGEEGLPSERRSSHPTYEIRGDRVDPGTVPSIQQGCRFGCGRRPGWIISGGGGVAGKRLRPRREKVRKRFALRQNAEE